MSNEDLVERLRDSTKWFAAMKHHAEKKYSDLAKDDPIENNDTKSAFWYGVSSTYSKVLDYLTDKFPELSNLSGDSSKESGNK